MFAESEEPAYKIEIDMLGGRASSLSNNDTYKDLKAPRDLNLDRWRFGFTDTPRLKTPDINDQPKLIVYRQEDLRGLGVVGITATLDGKKTSLHVARILSQIGTVCGKRQMITFLNREGKIEQGIALKDSIKTFYDRQV